MKNSYALHKKFIKDIDRLMKREENLEKVVIYAINYLSLRQVHSDEISNYDLMEVARKISFVDLELLDVYREMLKELSNHEFVFRVKRVKYIKNTKDSIMIVSSPLLKRIGKELMSTTINSDVSLLDDQMNKGASIKIKCSENSNDNSNDQIPVDTESALPVDHTEDVAVSNDIDPDLKYAKEIWFDPPKRLEWLLKNMKYANRKYGYKQENGYTPEEIAEATGRNVLTVKHYVREYLKRGRKN